MFAPVITMRTISIYIEIVTFHALIARTQVGTIQTIRDTFVTCFILCVIIGGNFAAININISHELMHKNNSLDQFFGMMTPSKNLYMRFLPQTLIGSIRDAWKIECKRLLEIKKKKTVWTLDNRMILFSINNILVPSVIYYIWEFLGVVCFLGTAFMGIFILEVNNYIEHYGLSRKEVSPGVYDLPFIEQSTQAQQLPVV